jgi:hypothetical protein
MDELFQGILLKIVQNYLDDNDDILAARESFKSSIDSWVEDSESEWDNVARDLAYQFFGWERPTE